MGGTRPASARSLRSFQKAWGSPASLTEPDRRRFGSVVEKDNELTRLIEEGSSRRNDRQRVGVCDHGGTQDSFDASKLSAEGGWRDVERFRSSRDARVPGYV